MISVAFVFYMIAGELTIAKVEALTTCQNNNLRTQYISKNREKLNYLMISMFSGSYNSKTFLK